MTFQSKFVQDLCTTDTEAHEQLIQLAQSEQIFLQNVHNLHKPSLEALVYALLMKQRGKLPASLLHGVNLQTILSLVDGNHDRLQGDSDSLRWTLSALALTALLESDLQIVIRELTTFVDRFERELHATPVYYDVLQTFLILAQELPELVAICNRANGADMVRRLQSDSRVMRTKALACLQTMMELNPDLVEQWLSETRSPAHPIERKVFLLRELLEALLRCTGDRKADILSALQLDHLWLVVFEALVSRDAVCRMEAVAILRHAIGYAMHCEMSFTGQYFAWWPEWEKCCDAWQSIVAVLERLDEFKLAVPMEQIEKLLVLLPWEWKTVLFRLLLDHTNGQVVMHVHDYFLKYRKFNATEAEMEKRLLDGLNRALRADGGSVPKVVIDKLSKYYGTQEAYDYLLQTIPELSWNPVAFHCIVSVVHQRTFKLAAECKRRQETAATIRSLTSCAKVCHDIKNLPLRFAAFVLLVHCVNQLAEPTTDAAVLLAVVAEMQKLTPMFAITQEHFRSPDGSLFLDRLTNDALEPHWGRVSPADTFLIEQVLVQRAKNSLYACLELSSHMLESNISVCCKLLGHMPELVNSVFDSICKNFQSAVDSIRQAQEAGERIPQQAFAVREQLIALQEAVDKRKFDYRPNLSGMMRLMKELQAFVDERLQSFDYADHARAIETIQLTHLIAWHEDCCEVASLFFQSVSVQELKNSLDRRGVGEAPTTDQVYAMVVEIHLNYRQHEQNFIEIYETEEHWSGLHILFEIDNVDVLTLAVELLYADCMKMGEECYENSNRVNMIDRCYEKILTHHQSEDHFLTLMSKFVKMLLDPFCAENIEYDDVYIPDFVLNYVSMFFEQGTSTTNELPLIVLECLDGFPDDFFHYCDWIIIKILAQGMIFGKGPMRDASSQVVDVIKRFGLDVPLKKRYQADGRMVRVMCSLFLHRFIHFEDGAFNRLVPKVEEYLMQCFSESKMVLHHVHRFEISPQQKLWAVQALCIAVSIAGCSKPDVLLKALLYEANPTCIQRLLELIVVDSEISTLAIANSLKDGKVTPAGIESICGILWLRCCRDKTLNNQSIYLLMPWTMAESFTIGLWAQITISKLLARFARADKPQFKQMYTMFKQSHQQTNIKPHVTRILRDVRFQLDSNCLLTFENVFHNIPKAAGVPAEDVAGTALLKACVQLLDGLGEKFLGKAMRVQKLPREVVETNRVPYQPTDWTGYFVPPEHAIVPLKRLDPRQDLMLELPYRLYNSQQKREASKGLYVVASNVTDVPDLADLARMGKCFGIKQLLINSLQDLDSKQFKMRSASAEQWQTVRELKAHNVYSYLWDLQDKGYTVVNVKHTETPQSTPLHQLQLPKKCVLVLNLLERFPHAVLNVYIPPIGAKRLLTVPETAALLMWEYAKQHHAAAM
uniref:uncharacterized protein LOC120952898 isoform X1 n=1 Tax=Anopheles coluzzii TaxID=1518534 RepID=UPI0020FFD853|nr:uncharacterized protein LOC120952898 isoform X1 [Anopheles coluzzii]